MRPSATFGLPTPASACGSQSLRRLSGTLHTKKYRENSATVSKCCLIYPYLLIIQKTWMMLVSITSTMMCRRHKTFLRAGPHPLSIPIDEHRSPSMSIDLALIQTVGVNMIDLSHKQIKLQQCARSTSQLSVTASLRLCYSSQLVFPSQTSRIGDNSKYG